MSESCTICATPTDRFSGGITFVYEDQEFFFCSEDCLKIFKVFPEVYVADDPSFLSAIEDTGI